MPEAPIPPAGSLRGGLRSRVDHGTHRRCDPRDDVSPNTSLGDAAVQDLETLAKLVGARVGLLRVMTETQLQASTDSLTGLLNRRSLENKVQALRREGIDLRRRDGRPRSLQATQRRARARDRGSRAAHCSRRPCGRRCEATTSSVARVVRNSPSCSPRARSPTRTWRSRRCAPTCSTRSKDRGFLRSPSASGSSKQPRPRTSPMLLARADAALLQAKRAGRDRVVVHDRHGGPIIFEAEHPQPNQNGSGKPRLNTPVSAA